MRKLYDTISQREHDCLMMIIINTIIEMGLSRLLLSLSAYQIHPDTAENGKLVFVCVCALRCFHFDRFAPSGPGQREAIIVQILSYFLGATIATFSVIGAVMNGA